MGIDRYFKLPKQVRQNSGFSLVEALVAVGIMGVLIATIVSVMTYLEKTKSQSSLTPTLISMQNNIQSLLINDVAWDKTLAVPANMATTLACLPNSTNCAHTAKPPAPNPLTNAYYLAAPFIDMPVLAETNGTSYIDNTTATSGFNANGSRCTTFDGTNGNDICPIRWELRVALICPDLAGPCNNPAVEIFGILRFSPSAGSTRFPIVNESKYRVSVSRGSLGKNRSERFEVSYGSAGQYNGGGACALSAWTQIIFNPIPDFNEGNNMILSGAIVSVNPGTYNCSFSATCFECSGFQTRLIHPGGVTLAPGSLATNGILARSGADNVTFTTTTPANIRLEYFAEALPTNHPSTPDDERQYCLGMTLPDYGAQTKFAQLNCVRIY